MRIRICDSVCGDYNMIAIPIVFSCSASQVLEEEKEFYTALINSYISDPEQHLKVFDKNSVYLPTKKIGKNNPKEAEIKADNEARQEWNRIADMALVTGIAEAKITEIKQTEIQDKASESIRKSGWLPDILKEDGYPDVQAFMATYREIESVVERYEREVWKYNLKLKQKEKPTKKPPEKQSVREHLRQLQEQGKQQSHKTKSFDRNR